LHKCANAGLGDGRQGDGRAHELRHALALDLVERFEHVNTLGENQVGEEEPLA
jgi:hypothetical protein